ncbi:MULTISPECIES: hypothetical protein [Falsihalocynthiibacter]|uniref:hypothetical protein n=2 Tax=Roseobacteraceae TaxID=2854170 RepID=UPI0030031112
MSCNIFGVSRYLILAFVMSLLAAGVGNSAPEGRDTVLITGLDNFLHIESTSGNTLSLTVTGSENGGLGRTWDSNPLLLPSLKPGNILQSGDRNTMDIDVLGTNTLFSVVQNGNDNSIRGYSSGTSNAFTVVQSGQQNQAVFSQQGSRNSLSIFQGSW